MNHKRTLLSPIAWLAGISAFREYKNFLKAIKRTPDVQQSLLKRLINASIESRFGEDHHFKSINSYRDFTSAVPIGDYQTHLSYIKDVFFGDTSALFSHDTDVCMFAITSGTTGEPKHIPVTRQFIRDYRRGWNIFGVKLLEDHPDGWLREIVTVDSTASEYLSPSGVPCGAISGLLAENQKWIVRKMYPVPRLINQITDYQQKYYAILRSSITHDVGIFVTANPSTAVKLAQVGRDNAERIIRDVHDGTITLGDDVPDEITRGLKFSPNHAAAKRLEEVINRHGQLLPKYFWRLSCIGLWTGGTVGLYLPLVRKYYGDVPVRDIGLLASEGRFSIPLDDSTPSGVAEITSNFLEFIPADQIESDSPDVLLAHEVEVGKEYFLVFSNWSGLWRYNIDDRVRITGRLGNCPVFEFLSKGVHTCSITGEKITEHQVVQAMSHAAASMGMEVQRFTLQGHFADPPYYQLNIEPADRLDMVQLTERMDNALRELNIEYDSKRASNRLGPIRLNILSPGTLIEYESQQIRQRHGRAEQYKHKYLMTEIINDLISSEK